MTTRLEQIKARRAAQQIEPPRWMMADVNAAVDVTFWDAPTAIRNLAKVSALALGGPLHGRFVDMVEPIQIGINPVDHDGVEITVQRDGTVYYLVRFRRGTLLLTDDFPIRLYGERFWSLAFHSVRQIKPYRTDAIAKLIRTEIAATGIRFTLSDHLELDIPCPMERVITISDHPKWKPLVRVAA